LAPACISRQELAERKRTDKKNAREEKFVTTIVRQYQKEKPNEKMQYQGEELDKYFGKTPKNENVASSSSTDNSKERSASVNPKTNRKCEEKGDSPIKRSKSIANPKTSRKCEEEGDSPMKRAKSVTNRANASIEVKRKRDERSETSLKKCQEQH
jgi:hypothetical protein